MFATATTLQLFGVAQPVEGPRNPGEFDMRAYLARQDIRHALVVRYPENGRILSRGHGSRIMRAAQTSRAWMQAALSRGLEDSPDLCGLISGMVLGVRDDTPDEIEEQFQQTGTLHLFAVSGLNVAIVAQLLWVIGSAARLPRRWAIGLIIPALFFYAAVTGLNASSIRAALMAAFILGGFFVDRRVLPGNSVAAAAVLVLCFDTNQLFSTGFQLSFAVVIAILLLGQPLFKFLVRWSEPDPFLPKSSPRPIAKDLATHLARDRGRRVCFARGMDWFAAADPPVFLHHHAGVALRESRRGAAGLLCPGCRIDLAPGHANRTVARDHFQQRQLEPGGGDSRRRRLVHAGAGGTFLFGITALADRCTG